MPDEVVPLHAELELDEASFAALSLGLVPESQDDRWFAYVEDGTLTIHRSWTGAAVYRAEFSHDGNSWRLRRAFVNPLGAFGGAVDDVEAETGTLVALIEMIVRVNR